MAESLISDHGRNKQVEQGDPMELHVIGMSGGDEMLQLQIYVEEYISMGMTKDEILEIFKNPFYAGLYSLFHRLGEPTIMAVLEENYKKFKFIGDTGPK
jgi:hypothetical protein